MSPVVDFSKVANYRNRKLPLPTDEPIWQDQDGNRCPISQLPNGHLQNIERYMRGGGATQSKRPASANGLKIIQNEMKRRELPVLPDHPAALTRNKPVPQVPIIVNKLVTTAAKQAKIVQILEQRTLSFKDDREKRDAQE